MKKECPKKQKLAENLKATNKEELISELSELTANKNQPMTTNDLDLDLIVEAHFTDKSQIFPLSIFSLSEIGVSVYYKESDLKQWEIEIPALSMEQIWRFFLDENPLFSKQLSEADQAQAYPKFLKAIQGERDKDGLFLYPIHNRFFVYLFEKKLDKILKSKTIIASEDTWKNSIVIEALTEIFGKSNVLKFDEEKINKKKKEEVDKLLDRLPNNLRQVLVLAQFLQDLSKKTGLASRNELKKYEEIVSLYEKVKSGERTINEFESALKSIEINRQEFVPILDELKDNKNKQKLMKLLEVQEVQPEVGGVVRDKDVKFLDVVNKKLLPMKSTWVISEVTQTGYRYHNDSLKKASVFVTERQSRVPFTKISFVIALLMSGTFLMYLFQYTKLSGWSIAGLILGVIILILRWSKIANKEAGWLWNLSIGMFSLFIAKPQISLIFLAIPISWLIVKQIFTKRRGNWLITILLPFIFSTVGGVTSIAWVRHSLPVVIYIFSYPPGGTVRIDGKIAGKTQMKYNIKPGRYTIKITDVSGYEPIEQQIQVPRGKNSTYEFKLKRTSKGTITVTEDFAIIRAGPTDYSSILAEIRRGTKLELLERKGDWQEVRLPDGTEGWIYVKKEEKREATSNSTQKRTAETVRIKINSDPSGASVFINGVYYGKTLLSVDLKPGRYLVDIIKSGYQPIKGHMLPVNKKGDRYFNFPLYAINP